jgi:Tfp pilus assembly protein PilE
MFKKYKENGYSLLEISIAVGMAMIMLAVGIPTFNNALEYNDANAGRTSMINAGMILESERLRNNGVYPIVKPTQISRNSDMNSISITYGFKQLSYCMYLETDRGNKFYMKNTDKEPFQILDASNPCDLAAFNP